MKTGLFANKRLKNSVCVFRASMFVSGTLVFVICGLNPAQLGEQVRKGMQEELVKTDVIPPSLDAAVRGGTVRILNILWNGGAQKVTVCSTGPVTKDSVAAVVNKCPKMLVCEKQEDEAYPCVGGAVLPGLKPFEAWESDNRISGEGGEGSRFWVDVFACEIATGKVLGHFDDAVKLVNVRDEMPNMAEAFRGGTESVS